ncbi:MAG: DNA-packaging protein [Oscillospiraceae bacterium]|jgi:hypothetical protein|nr:DNA-packaging protein [Oscillospiraceae bacterium]
MNELPTVDEMAVTLAADSNRNGYKGKLYKEQSDQHKGEQLAEVTHAKREVLQEAANRPHIDLKDTQAVQERTFAYMEAAEQAKVFPSVSGLALAFGCSRQNLNQFLLAHPSHPTTDFIQQVKEAFADILQNAGLYGSANPIMSIFILKNSHGFVDRVDLAAVAQPMEEQEFDADEIRRRYLLDTDE